MDFARWARRAGALALLAVAAACAYNEELGRRQTLLVDDAQMASLGVASWNELKKQERITADPNYVSRVRRVADRLLRAAGENPAQWEVQVFASKDLNAFALPGRKIGFYTGILDLMENDDQIATVMGHEYAHVRFDHSEERYSQSMLAQTAMTAGAVALGASGVDNSDQLMAIMGMGASVGVILPFSRSHELEADKFGLRYMARAGYDPNEAIVFWRKMASQKGETPPEFMSTHPADATRIRALQEEIARLSAAAPAG